MEINEIDELAYEIFKQKYPYSKLNIEFFKSLYIALSHV